VKGLTPTIESILAQNPKARDSDNLLIVQVLLHYGADFTPHQIALLNEMSFESITRCRRKLQEQGKFLPSPEVAKKRRLKSYIVQQNAPSASPSRLQRVIELNPEDIW
jgi:hypothetical protein